MEDDALLGHLVGQIPPSIRFLAFNSTLSKESIQALCILIRTQNAAFIAEATELPGSRVFDRFSRKGTLATAGSAFSTGKTSITPSKIDISNNKNFGGAKEPPDTSSVASRGMCVVLIDVFMAQLPFPNADVVVVAWSCRCFLIHPFVTLSVLSIVLGFSKGLIGLALTHCVFETTEINHIVELLQSSASRNTMNKARSFRNPSGSGAGTAPRDRDSNASRRSGGDVTPTTPLGGK